MLPEPIFPPTGVRRQSYANYPYTYEDLGNEGFEVHNDGEIWAATLLDVRATLGTPTTQAAQEADATKVRPAVARTFNRRSTAQNEHDASLRSA